MERRQPRMEELLPFAEEGETRKPVMIRMKAAGYPAEGWKRSCRNRDGMDCRRRYGRGWRFSVAVSARETTAMRERLGRPFQWADRPCCRHPPCRWMPRARPQAAPANLHRLARTESQPRRSRPVPL